MEERKKKKKAKKNARETVEGLIFLIEMSYLFILDKYGEICKVKYNETEKNKPELNHLYKIKFLYYLERDTTNYLIYKTSEKTIFEEVQDNNISDKYAIIRIIILDALNRELVKLSINNHEHVIKNNIQYISINNDDDSSYFLQTFKLIIRDKIQTFNLFIYKGELNNINCSILKNKGNKCYEIIYLAKNEYSLPRELEIAGYTIRYFDKFSCTNRIRFNIINVEKDENFNKYDYNLSSYEIIYLINENNIITKYGIFNVDFAKHIAPKDFIIDEEFSNLLKKFYKGYKKRRNKNINLISDYFSEQIGNIKKKLTKKRLSEFENLLLTIVYNYTRESLNKENSFIFFRNYCLFIFAEFLCSKSSNSLQDYSVLLTRINKYTFFDKIRILLSFACLIKQYEKIPLLFDISDVRDDHPYHLAIKLQKDIINGLNETSNIYYPLLQFNSKILELLPDNKWDYTVKKIKACFNCKIRKKLAYTISLESLQNMKSHLLTAQENFFFIFDQENRLDFLGLYLYTTRITVINQYTLCRKMLFSSKIDYKMNYAFSISLVFSHERMGHAKEVLCNPGIPSPNLYFNKNFEKDYVVSEYSKPHGESGRMLESFIPDKALIKFMKTSKCFGKFLNSYYFIGDTNEIQAEALKVFQTSKFYKKYKNKKLLLCILVIIIYAVIYIICYAIKKNLYNNQIFIILYTFIFAILIASCYKYYNNENLKNLNTNKLDDIDSDYIDEEQLIYPDDYPFESDTFLGRYFPWLEFENNRIRRKLAKYVDNKIMIY